MTSKDLPEIPPKKPRSADIHKSLKGLSLSLKPTFEHFLKCTAQITRFTPIDPATTKFSSLVSALESIGKNLDSLRPVSRVKFLREDPALLPALFQFINSLCQSLSLIPDDFGSVISQAESDKQNAFVVYGQALGIIVVIGNLLVKRIIGEGYAFEPLIKVWIKLGVVKALLSSLGLYWKALNFVKVAVSASQKHRETVSKLFLVYAELLYTIIQHGNEDIISELANKGLGEERLKGLLKASYEQKQYEGYCYLLGIVPMVAMTPEAIRQVFKILKDQLLELSLSGEYTNLYPPIVLAIRALLVQSKEKLEDMDTLEQKVRKVNKEAYKGKRKKVFCCSAYLLFEIWLLKGIKKEEEKEDAEEIEWKQYMHKEMRNYQSLKEELNLIKTKHYDCPQVVVSLGKIQKLIHQSEEIQLSFIVLHNYMNILIRCLLNLDESVMTQSLMVFHDLLSRESHSKTLFIKKRGFPTLSDCLADYNLGIKTYSLKILSLIIADNKDAKESIRETEILKQILRIISSYPTYDVNLTVLDAALDVLSHVVTSSPANQNFVRDLNGFAALTKVFGKITAECGHPSKDADKEKSLLSVLENLCLCLSNICFHNPLNQEALLKQGIISQLLAVLLTKTEKTWWLTKEIVQQMVFILVNATDTNSLVQDNLLSSSADKLVSVIDSYLFSENHVISGYMALWISHISFNSKKSQELLVVPKYVNRLLQLCDYKELVALSEEVAQQISFFALLAVINLSYSNPVAQQIILEKSGISLLCTLLKDNNFAPKKTVCFALSNVIRDNPITQKELLSSNGVELLAELVSDEEDDELSKKAFNTLEDLDKFAIDGLYPLIIAVSKTLSEIVPAESIDGSLETNTTAFLEEGKFDPKHAEELASCKEKLGKYLPIYNGLVYMSEAVRMHALIQYGVKELWSMLDFVPLCFIPQLLYIVANLTIDKCMGKATTLTDPKFAKSCINVLEKTRRVELVATQNEKITEINSLEELLGIAKEIRAGLYGVLTNLVYRRKDNAKELLKEKGIWQFLLKDAKKSESGSTELRAASINLVVSAMELLVEDSIEEINQADIKECLNSIVAGGEMKLDEEGSSSDTLKARVKQLLERLRIITIKP